ncbi:unnamed protein product [Agarophyton chilense]|eukprot:gb/GEZJ01002488.1/.p1 GENE.gb/GEZJ01002488.1/~~gb/GEZJ01002488.1/.p1  ORF type:complete len:950 (+),score=146.02 gb/GEZJ01002488.1/:376-3225(+)
MDLETPEEAERLDTLNAFAKLADKSIGSNDLAAISRDIEGMCSASCTRMRTNPHAVKFVVHSISRCAVALPIKSPLYAAVTGLLTCGGEPFTQELGSRLVEAIAKEFELHVRAGKSSAARRALRFLACLTDCRVVSAVSMTDQIIALLEATIFEFSEAERSERGVHCRGVFLGELALSPLPWVAKAVHERAPEKLETISNLIDRIESVWDGSRWRGLAPANKNRSVPSFSELLIAFNYIRNDNWNVSADVIPRPQDQFPQLSHGGLDLALPSTTVPAHSKLSKYSCPRFRMILVNPKQEKIRPLGVHNEAEMDEGRDDPKKLGEDASNTELPLRSQNVAVSSPTNLEGGSDNDDKKREDIAKKGDAVPEHMQNGGSDLPQPGKQQVSADPMNGSMEHPAEINESESANGTALNKEAHNTPGEDIIMRDDERQRTPVIRYILRCYIADIIDNFGENHALAAERLLNLPVFRDQSDEIVESVFSQMCATPTPCFPPVYFGTLFVDLCRVKETRLPTNLLTAVNTMFQEAGDMDPESFDRLTEWFSFHLSNFGYKWNWSDWALYADAEMVDKFPYRALFCKDVLCRCVRLSYYERIAGIVPQEMSYFFPPAPGTGDRSRFDPEINDELMKIVTGKGKRDAVFVNRRLSELIPFREVKAEEGDKETMETEVNLARLSALIRSILQAGCRTLSHFDIVSERYEDILRELSTLGGSFAKRLVTQEVVSFWKDVHIRKMYVLDKLCARSVIDGKAIIDSCLAFERVSEKPGQTERISDKEIETNLINSGCWELIRLVMSRGVSREEAARSELQRVSQKAASANEGEIENVGSLLQDAKRRVELTKNEVAELVLVAQRRLFGVFARLLSVNKTDSDDVVMGQGEERELPGFNGKPIWYWRCAGMMRELARKHARHLSIIIDQLDNDTRDNRDQHRVLWESFETIKEIEASDMLNRVW